MANKPYVEDINTMSMKELSSVVYMPTAELMLGRKPTYEQIIRSSYAIIILEKLCAKVDEIIKEIDQ